MPSASPRLREPVTTFIYNGHLCQLVGHSQVTERAEQHKPAQTNHECNKYPYCHNTVVSQISQTEFCALIHWHFSFEGCLFVCDVCVLDKVLCALYHVKDEYGEVQ